MTHFVDRSTIVTASWLNAADEIVTDPTIIAMANVAPVADQLIYFTSATTAALASFTSTGRAIVSAPDNASVLTAIGGLANTGNPCIGGVSPVWDRENVLHVGGTKGGHIRGGDAGLVEIGTNLYYNGGWKYRNGDLYAALFYYYTVNGQYVWATAPKNTGGLGGESATLGTAMSLDNTGCLGVNMTNPGYGGAWKVISVKGGSPDQGGVLHLRNSDATVAGDILTSDTTYPGLSIRTTTSHGVNVYTASTKRAEFESGGDLTLYYDLKFGSAASRILVNGTAGPVEDRTLFQCHETNQNTILGAIPNGTATLAAVQVYNTSTPNGAVGYADIRSGTTEHILNSNALNGGTVLPLTVKVGGKQLAKFTTTGITELGSSTEDSRLRIYQRRDLTNPYALICSSYAPSFENDFFMGQTGTGFALGNYQSYALELKTSNTTRQTIDANGRTTFSTADYSGPQWLFSGTTKGARIFTSGSAAVIEGVDSTGLSSYQPLFVGGSTVTLTTSGSEVARATAARTLGARTTGYINRTSQSTSTTTHTIDWTASNYYQLTMGHNIATLTLTAPEFPCVVQLDIIQDATGSRTMTWPASLKWPSSYSTADKTISTAPNARDLLVLRWNGTDYVANLMKGIA